MLKWIALMVFPFLPVACVSNQVDFSDVVSHESFAKQGGKTVDVPGLNYETTYQIGEKQYVAQWIGCKSSANKQTFAVVSDGIKPFNSAEFCESPVAQAYLASGYNVMGINMPGFGSSTGDRDLGGKQSVTAVGAVLGDSRASLYQPIVGLHGTYLGGIAAAHASQVSKGVKALVLVSAIMDMEQTADKTTDASLKRAVAEMKAAPGGSQFFETRSIAWDFEGLPPTVEIIHGEDDHRSPVDQARSFRDSLATQERRVGLIILEKTGADIPKDQLGAVLRKVLSDWRTSTDSSKS